MAESFLKEQLERIRKMTERMKALETNAAELSDAMAQDRAAMRQGPLHEVRDYRLYSGEKVSGAADESKGAPDRRSEVRDSSRRRRRG